MTMTKNSLLTKKCTPCEGKTKALTKKEANVYLKNVPHWQMDAAGKVISREFMMKNFVAAVGLINRVADIAESENHHPDVHLVGYRKLTICLNTHAIDGLSENDFILAAKINELPVELKNV